MKIVQNLKEIKETAKKFNLKGRSKIKTYDELLKLMKKQGFENERKILMSVNRRLKNLHKRYQKQINNLSYPKSPLKGYGYDRRELYLKEQEDALMNFDYVSNHMTTVAYRRKKGYFGWIMAVSPELFELISSYLSDFSKIAKEFYSIKTKKEAEDEKAKKEEYQKLQKELKNLDKNDILKVFFEAEVHPAPQIICQLKKQSGMSWSELRDIYKSK